MHTNSVDSNPLKSVLAGHDGDGFITDCDLEDRKRHSGNLKLKFGPGTCLPRRLSYREDLCDGVTTAFNRVYDGGHGLRAASVASRFSGVITRRRCADAVA